MLQPGAIVTVSLAYLAVLFAIAWWGDRRADQGRSVIANVSRTVLGELVDRFAAACIVHITAAPEIIGTRLAARGREDTADIANRRARETPRFPSGAKVIAIVNDADPELGIAKFVELLRRTI